MFPGELYLLFLQLCHEACEVQLEVLNFLPAKQA